MKLNKLNAAAFSDEQLAALAAGGAAGAVEELYTRYSKKMLFYFYRMLGRDMPKAEDFLQDLFVKFYERPHLFDKTKKFSTWLYAVAGNMCKNNYRHMKIASGVDVDAANLDLTANEELQPEIDLKSFVDDLYMLLEELNLEHKEAFILRYANDLPIKEIAQITGCPEGTVKSRLFYSLKYLQQNLKKYRPIMKD